MKKLLLSLLTGILLFISWPNNGLSFFIFFAFVPLFILSDMILKKGLSSFSAIKFFFFSFFLFNVLTTYWIWNASPGGSIFAFIVNSLMMTFVFWTFQFSRKVISTRLSFFLLITVWISMEYIHLNWQLSWPWLILGNVFSNDVFLVQWYEYTGILGGSLWILLANIYLYKSFLNKKLDLKTSLVLIIPIIFSLTIKKNKTPIDKLDVIIVQPNIDPYTEKFTADSKYHFESFLSKIDSIATSETDLVLAPETFLQEQIWEHLFENSVSYNGLQKLINKYPNLNILIGATTFKILDSNSLTSTARKVVGKNIYYDVYNSAILISKKSYEFYHKTKLVPGAESTPFPKVFDKLSAKIIELGGISGSLASDNYLSSFSISKFKIKPLICYESVYGHLVNESDNLICVITNDGWWGDTQGYKQHFSYSKLRAIESRKSLVRSANTGISGVILPNGRVSSSLQWDKKNYLSTEVGIYDQKTFYNKYGDYLGRISAFISVMILLIFIPKRIIFSS